MRGDAQRLFAEFLAHLEAGRDVSLDELCRDHPDQQEELRSLWADHFGALPTGFFFSRREGNAPRPAPAGLGPGDTLGDFRLVSLLGQGGMGQVWEAEQLSLGRRVALKLVRPDRLSDTALGFFAREARAGGRLLHPGIVTVFGYGQDAGTAWIAMELVEGSWTLRDFLNDVAGADELPPAYHREVARLAAEIADALGAAHAAGVLHRDLKPQNVLVTPADHAKVSDFGLARIVDESALSHTGDFAGTYYYMSPEQVAARRMGIDHRSDVFSLGILLYEMLALRRPFEGDTTHQVAEKILTVDPPDLRQVRSRIPRDLAVICGKALEKSRERRYQSMAELGDDLRRFLAREPIQARPPGRLRKLELWARRHPVRSAAGAVALLALAIVSVLLAETIRARGRAAAEAAAVKRLADRQNYRDLLRRAGELWPAYPELRRDCEQWIADARALTARLPLHRATLAELRARSRATGESSAASDATRWWSRELGGLIADLESLSDARTGLLSHGTDPERGWGVPRRLDEAQALARVAGSRATAARWREAIDAARRSPLYGGLELAPQRGLVPLGADPHSGLLEFWHVQSGSEPARDALGRITTGAADGLVLVLLPGGRFQMGAQAERPDEPGYDPAAAGDEGPVHEVVLSPYFLAKHEMTQAQWMRLTGRNPSRYGLENPWVEDLAHPVEQVSWNECVRVLARLGLELPSEAQWEYAARAGTATPWWTGAAQDELWRRGALNVADQSAWRAGARWEKIALWPELDDGFPLHARAGATAANPFGLTEIHGNVLEWCRDGYLPDFYARSPERDPVAPTDPLARRENRVVRGGSYMGTAVETRCANRRDFSPTLSGSYLGLRPARALDD